MRKLVLACGVLAVATCSASAAAPIRVAVAGPRLAATVGQVWTAKLSVSPRSFRGSVSVVAVGPGRVVARASRAGGAYRARLVFPASGRWQLSARAGGSTSRLGAVTVRRPALTFAWPTSVALEPDGSLLVVENGRGRILQVDPVTGRVAVVRDGLVNPFAAVRAASGDIYLSGGRTLRRLDRSGTLHDLVTASEDIGPLTLAPDGDLVYTTSTRLFRLPAGGGTPQFLTGGLNSAHGVAITPDGAVLVSDTSNDRVRRIDPRTGAVTTLLETGTPRGLDVAADGTIHLVEARSKRVGRFGPTGARLGRGGPAFGDPYDVAVGPRGTAYVVDTAAAGRIVRVAADGTAVAIPTG
ncbi:MAG: Vgb family protein [Gaiellaceae bacterium]